MRKAVIFVALGLIFLGIAAWLLFPNARSDLIQQLPFFNKEPQEVTLKYWGIWEPREVIQPLLDKYQQEHPNITIEYEERDPSDYAQRLTAKLGIEGGPDIVRMHATWFPLMYKKLAPMPSTVMSVNEYEETFYPVNKVFLKKNGSYYGIPLMIEGLALVYNKDLFAEAGLDDPPRDWSQFRDYARLLTKRNSNGEIVQAGAALGFAENIDYFEDIVGLMMAQSGVKFVDEDGNVRFHNTVSQLGGNLGVEALRFYSFFARKDQSWDPNWENSTTEFSKGRVAMVFLPSHRLLKILNSNPSFDIGIATVPQLSADSTSRHVAWANYWAEGVSKTSVNTQEAWKFLKWLSEKEQLSMMYTISRNVRAFGEPFPRRDLSTALNADKYTLPYVEQGEIYTTWFFTYGVTNPSLNDPIKRAMSEMVTNVANGADIEDELSKAANAVQLILNNNIE